MFIDDNEMELEMNNKVSQLVNGLNLKNVQTRSDISLATESKQDIFKNGENR